MKRDGDGKPGEHESGGVIKGEADRLLAADRAFDENAERGERVLADGEDDETGERQGGDEVDEGKQSVVGPGWKIAVHNGGLKPLSPCGRGRDPLRSSGRGRGLSQ